jgi:aminoglycoside phosphotransferase (APT) family kinase protein
VVDWANARAGDPRADLARTTAILRLAPTSPGLAGRIELVLRRLLEEGWRRGYMLAAGWPRDLAPFHAWAGDAMYRDLAPKLGRPGIPLTQADLDRIRSWTARWR